MFCTLQQVWQALLPPKSATGMGNTWAATKAGKAASPRYSINDFCFALKMHSIGHVPSNWFSNPLCIVMKKL